MRISFYHVFKTRIIYWCIQGSSIEIRFSPLFDSFAVIHWLLAMLVLFWFLCLLNEKLLIINISQSW